MIFKLETSLSVITFPVNKIESEKPYVEYKEVDPINIESRMVFTGS